MGRGLSLSKIKEEVPNLRTNGWILDDGVLAGLMNDVTEAMEILVKEGPARGLQLSTERSVAVAGSSKCRVWSTSRTLGDDPLGLGVLQVKEDGFVHLGAPVGSPAFIQAKVGERVSKVAQLLENLHTLQNPNAEFVLLRSCFSLPKVSYLARTCPTSPSSLNLWESFDGLIRDSTNRILGTSLSDNSWLQAQMAVVKGGLGLRSALRHASAAFLASWSSCQALIEQLAPTLDLSVISTAEAREHLSRVLNYEEILPEEVVSGLTQKELSLRIDTNDLKNLVEYVASTRDKARLLSVQLPHAGDWLNVIPSSSLGLQLRAPEFRASVLYRLGMPIFPSDGACVACGLPSDKFGDHAVGCASQGERIARHNHLRDALYHTAASAHLAPLREERALLPGAGDRPADVLIPHFAAGGRHMAVDVCVVSSLQAQLVDGAATEPGHALTYRYHQKWTKYSEACAAEGVCFQPLPFEVLGGVHDAAVGVIKKLGQALARSGGLDENETVRHLFGRLSILLMRGNAALVLSRTVNHPHPRISGEQ